MNQKLNVLMVEDSESLVTIYSAYLRDERYLLHSVSTLDEARSSVDEALPDLVLLDIELPDGDGMDFLQEIAERYPHVPVIVMTAHGSSDMAVHAIRIGAFDFLTKPFDASRLKVTMANARKHLELDRRVREMSHLNRKKFCGLIGASLAMQAVYRTIESVGASNATAFIVGESGTGKELTAEAIHAKSRRSSARFHALNCAAIPKDLMESELFGHVKGAFTGATSAREGAAAIADGGTLFLDEICEMDLELQKKLLRFVQTGTFQKVGSNRTEKVDIRFICATNRDPFEEVQQGRFREDLYYRLHVIPVELPPLRARGDDVLILADHFLARHSKDDGKAFQSFSPSARKALLRHDWPGNVRELENTIRRVVVLNTGHEVLEDMLPFDRQRLATDATNGNEPVIETSTSAGNVEPLWLMEKRAILAAIELCDGNVNQASALLEVAPSTVYRKLQSWQEEAAN